MKILLYTDLTIRSDQLFWHRDLGLLTKAFRALGHEAYLVVHLATEPRPAPDSFSHSEIRAQARPATAGKNPRVSASRNRGEKSASAPFVAPAQHGLGQSRATSKIPEEPVLWPFPSDVRDPLWWKDHHPDLVILGLWTRPKYDPTGRAALASKARLIERCDSVGFRLPSCGHWQFWKNTISAHNDALPNRPIAIDTSESRD